MIFRDVRPLLLEAAQNMTFDVVIVGGGITGAGIAREASLAGLRVALFEQNDFASGTSSRSTKIFHGGLRYLEHGELRLVRQSGREREWMARYGAHLVSPLPMLLPVYRGSPHGLAAMALAVYMYDWLAGVPHADRRRVLSPRDVIAAMPTLRAQGLIGGILYREYRTDDARTTVTVIRSAVVNGAVAVNYARVVGLLLDHTGHVEGVTVRDELNPERLYRIQGRFVVNASGPWSDSLLAMDPSLPAPHLLQWSRGVHVVVPRSRLPVEWGVSAPTPDHRLLFVVPRGERVYIGTTDEPYEESIDHPPVRPQDVDYLLNLVNRLFPDARLSSADVVGQWAGIRPLIRQPGRASKDISRRERILVAPSGLITIAGGKLTAWRQMAQEVVDEVHRQWVRRYSARGWESGLPHERHRRSLHIPLPGSSTLDPGTYRQAGSFITRRLQMISDIADVDAQMLVARYGTEAESVLKQGLATWGPSACKRLHPSVPLLAAELPYAMDTEMAIHLSDILVRRTDIGRFDGPLSLDILTQLAEAMGQIAGWSPDTIIDEVRRAQYESYWDALPVYGTPGDPTPSFNSGSALSVT